MSKLRAAAQRLPIPIRRVARVARPWFPLPESVLLFAFPEIDLGSNLRDRYDRSARAGMPPHVTLIYPFIRPEDIDQKLLEELGRFFGSTSRFTVRLEGIGGFPGVVYLVPEPRDRFTDLVTGLVTLYPQAPPYGGLFQSIIPHLTLAESADPEVQDRVMSAVLRVLPIETEAVEAWLMVRQRRRWKTTARFALAAAQNSRRTEHGIAEQVAS
jgi:2'-5' RNA ligase